MPGVVINAAINVAIKNLFKKLVVWENIGHRRRYYMCGIAGFYQSHFDYLTKEEYYRQILEEMERVQKHRGPDEQGNYLESHFGLAHVRLSIRDLVSGRQPILKKVGDKTFGIVYNGELYNTKDLQDELME